MPKQAVTVELFYDGAWRDVTADDDVRADTPITIRRGQGDESPAFRPCSITCRLDNTDDRYRTSNPVSPLYGKAGRNTPIRVSVGGVVRGVAQVSSWRPDQSRDFRASPKRGKAWTDLEAAGTLQQIAQWTQPARSALYRANTLSAGFTPAEYWPMEDPSGSQLAASAAGGTPMRPVTAARYTLPDGSVLPPGGAPRFADGAGIAGSAPLVSLQGGGTLTAPVRTATYNGYAVDWVMQFQAGTDEGGTTTANVLSWRESGTYVHFTVNVTKNNISVFHSNAADDSIAVFTGSASASFDVYDGAPHHFRYQVRQNGGSYLAQLYVDSAVYATADNFVPGMTGTVGQPIQIEWNPIEDSGDFLPIAAGHLAIWKSGQIGGQPAAFNAINGRASEKAAIRYARICAESGVDLAYASSGYASSMPMGPQRPATLPELLRECVTTEDALLYDLRTLQGIYFQCRVDRYDLVPVELFPEDLVSLPAEVTDDLPVHNVVTASQNQGGDATARDDTGPLGTADAPTGVGEYQQSVDVNVDKEVDQLPQVANWWLRKGTVNLPRYPQIVINLAALSPARIAQLEAIEVGTVVTLSNFRENTLRLTVLGYTEVIGTTSRVLTLLTAPDQQYDVGVWDATDSRWDSATSTIAACGPTDTSWTISTTNVNETWSTSAGYDLVAGGERVTCTAMGAVSGTGPYVQTATVRRSVNGIVKAQTASTQVRVFSPGRWAL